MKKLMTLMTLSIVSVLSLTSTAFAASPENFNHATASWTTVNNIKCYNLYYKASDATRWQHSVRCLPKAAWMYDVKYLKQGVKYVYTVSALNYSGKEFNWTPVKDLVTSTQ